MSDKIKCNKCGLEQDAYNIKKYKAGSSFFSANIDIEQERVIKCINCESGNLEEVKLPPGMVRLEYDAI